MAALGVYPYITSSIVMQILTPVIPNLKALSQEGESGRQRLNQMTHWLTVPIAFLQAWGQLTLLRQSGVLPGVDFGLNIHTFAMVCSMVAGTMFLVWLGELITERGLGNGISLIIFGGIVATFPQVIGQGFLDRDEASGLLLLGIIGFAIIYLIVLFNEAQRRVPVQYGRSVFRGGQMQRQSGLYVPALARELGRHDSAHIRLLHHHIAGHHRQLLPQPAERRLRVSVRALHVGHAGPDEPALLDSGVRAGRRVHLLLHAGNLPAAEPGGEPATQRRIHPRHTAGAANAGVPQTACSCESPGAAALFLGFVAIAPFFVTQATDVRALTLSSTSLLIMVGVALDTMRQLEAQLLMRNYEGFIR